MCSSGTHAGSTRRSRTPLPRVPRLLASRFWAREERLDLAVQFKGVLPQAASWFAYAPVDLDGQVDIAIDVTPR